jgi:hypothetical protein
MNHERLREAAGKCRAAVTLMDQFPPHGAAFHKVALEAIADIAEAVAENAPTGEDVGVRQLSLGEVISLLEAWPKKDDSCRFDFGDMAPDCAPDSYRGYYDHLAMGFKEGDTYPNPTVQEVLDSFKSAVGKEFMGYKGGKYLMTERTPVWVANYGRTGSTVIVGCYLDRHHFMFRTANID